MTTQETPTYLYHGTTSSKLRAIMKKGLLPRGARRGQWDKAPSRPDHVYLTNAYPVHFAKCAAGNDTNRRADLLVLRIDVDKLNLADLYADEDALEQFNREKDKARWPTMEERTAFYRDAWRFMDAAKAWRSSLGALGNCSHFGSIPAAAISGVAVMPRNCPLAWACDPTIALINYKLMGTFYRATAAFPFEGAPPPHVTGPDTVIGDVVGARHIDGLRDPRAAEGIRVAMRPEGGWTARAVSPLLLP